MRRVLASYQDGKINIRDASYARIDKRDLGEDGRPKPGVFNFDFGAEVARSPDSEVPGWVDYEYADMPKAEPGETLFEEGWTDAELAEKLIPKA